MKFLNLCALCLALCFSLMIADCKANAQSSIFTNGAIANGTFALNNYGVYGQTAPSNITFTPNGGSFTTAAGAGNYSWSGSITLYVSIVFKDRNHNLLSNPSFGAIAGLSSEPNPGTTFTGSGTYANNVVVPISLGSTVSVVCPSNYSTWQSWAQSYAPSGYYPPYSYIVVEAWTQFTVSFPGYTNQGEDAYQNGTFGIL